VLLGGLQLLVTQVPEPPTSETLFHTLRKQTWDGSFALRSSHFERGRGMSLIAHFGHSASPGANGRNRPQTAIRGDQTQRLLPDQK
jgi:hypothetical protein